MHNLKKYIVAGLKNGLEKYNLNVFLSGVLGRSGSTMDDMGTPSHHNGTPAHHRDTAAHRRGTSAPPAAPGYVR